MTDYAFAWLFAEIMLINIYIEHFRISSLSTIVLLLNCSRDMYIYWSLIALTLTSRSNNDNLNLRVCLASTCAKLLLALHYAVQFSADTLAIWPESQSSHYESPENCASTWGRYPPCKTPWTMPRSCRCHEHMNILLNSLTHDSCRLLTCHTRLATHSLLQSPVHTACQGF